MAIMESKREHGVMLLEALLAILIFSIGILAMVAMQARAIGYSADAKYRSDASFLANQIISQIWVDRGTDANMSNMPAYTTSGGTGTYAPLTNWLGAVGAALPGVSVANNTMPTIAIGAPTGTAPAPLTRTVTVTVNWLPPNATAVHSYITNSIISNP